jgi:hypothetical protein
MAAATNVEDLEPVSAHAAESPESAADDCPLGDEQIFM